MVLEADSEFMGLISTKSTSEILAVMDELMDRLMEVNPKLYQSVICRLQNG